MAHPWRSTLSFFQDLNLHPQPRILGPARDSCICTGFTAKSLNSAVYSCFGILYLPALHFAYPIHTGLEDEIPGEAHSTIELYGK
jgi:hypothetical protein